MVMVNIEMRKLINFGKDIGSVGDEGMIKVFWKGGRLVKLNKQSALMLLCVT